MQGQKGDHATLLDVYEAPLYDGTATNSKVIIFKVLCRPITPRMVIQVIGDRKLRISTVVVFQTTFINNCEDLIFRTVFLIAPGQNLIGQKFDWAKFDFDLITSVSWANTYQFSHVRFLVLLLFVVSWLCDLMVANTSHCHFSNALSI